ncbi:unnamed protein product [Coregonus sp. 'balchen']|nr:unnamed protein product [Coregonus sp. 'balchen']
MSCQGIGLRQVHVLLLWEGVALGLCCCWTWAGVAGASAGPSDAGPMGWLLSGKGPFHDSLEFTESVARYQQGYTTRYKIYR